MPQNETKSSTRALTPRQKAKVRELEEISKLTNVDFWNVENLYDDNDVRNIVLDLAKDSWSDQTSYIHTY
jgi:hypothetical protein